MDFQQLADVAEKWCSNTPFELIATEETERRMDFYADPGVSFYVLCPDNGCGDNFHVWSESEDCLPFLQLAQDYISSCGKKTLHEVLEKVFKSFRPENTATPQMEKPAVERSWSFGMLFNWKPLELPHPGGHTLSAQ
uniref:Maturin n=1 Tax=Felis catus TaxID=9685 RepID=A0ABI7XIB7_FELCA